MLRHRLTDGQWELIEAEFPQPPKMGRPVRDRRTIFDSILWIMRTGSPWRDLPEEFGPWQTAWDLFNRWNGDGTLDKILRLLRSNALESDGLGNELWCVDGTSIRAAKCAAGGGKKTNRKNQKTMLSGVLEAV